MLNVVMLSVIIVSVVAPIIGYDTTRYLLAQFVTYVSICVPYFIKYNVHTNIRAHLNFTMIFDKKYYFYLSRIISQELITASLFIITHLKPFVNYLPCIVRKEYFSIIFNVKKCALD